MKLKVQAQHLQPGDIVGSGEKVIYCGNRIKTPKGKVEIVLEKNTGLLNFYRRAINWGKYTMINVEREEKINQSDIIRSGGGSNM